MDYKQYINLTPHDFIVLNRKGEKVRFPTTNIKYQGIEGVLTARAEIISFDRTTEKDEFPINGTRLGKLQFEVTDPHTRECLKVIDPEHAYDILRLPVKPNHHPFYIVSAMVAPAMQEKGFNVVIGAKMLKDENGDIYQTGFAIPQ